VFSWVGLISAERISASACLRAGALRDINYSGLSINDINYFRLMGRPRINEDHTPARLPAGTLARIQAVLREGERRADFIRAAIERELKRREGMDARKAAK
jgi:hypothetical protein